MATTKDFRDFLRAADDPRIAGIGAYDAYGFAEHALQVPRIRALVDGWERLYAEPFRGITDGTVPPPGLFALADEGAPVAAAAEAAGRLLALAAPHERARLCHDLQAREWRAWMNPEFYLQRHGLRLEEIAVPLREAVLDVLRASLGAQGFARARDLMRINGFLGDLVGAPRVMNEYSYNFNLFGQPSLVAPWGWNFYGHHLCLNCLLLGRQMVLTPVFMGAEPHCIDTGPHAGTRAFEREEADALALMRSLPASLQQRAQLYARKRDAAMPPGRVAVGDELHLGGAFQDNRRIPREGVRADAFGAGQRRALMDLVDLYLATLPPGPRQARLAQVERYLDATHLCWIGGTGDDDPFYYRVQSPVLVVEFDHHAGVFLGNAEPEKFHVHTLVRTPNGNDYGMDLVRQHCERARTPG